MFHVVVVLSSLRVGLQVFVVLPGCTCACMLSSVDLCLGCLGWVGLVAGMAAESCQWPDTWPDHISPSLHVNLAASGYSTPLACQGQY